MENQLNQILNGMELKDLRALLDQQLPEIIRKKSKAFQDEAWKKLYTAYKEYVAAGGNLLLEVAPPENGYEYEDSFLIDVFLSSSTGLLSYREA